MPDKQLWLASNSPTRRELLRATGIGFELVPIRRAADRADFDDQLRTGETEEAYVDRVAREKAAAGWGAVLMRQAPARLRRVPVVAAKTIVRIDDTLLGKPGDVDEAERMLLQLSGRTHTVHTAIAMAWEGTVHARTVTSRITLRALQSTELARYLASGEWCGKCGARAIEGRGALFVTRVDGSPSAAAGLPLAELASLLADCTGETALPGLRAA